MLLYGQPGVGKTALAISTAHSVQEDFPDGILWYQLDTSSLMDILAAIAQVFGHNISNIQDVSIRASLVRSITAKKRILFIFDNIEHKEDIEYILPGGTSCSALLTSIQSFVASEKIDKRVHISTFSLKETQALFNMICGEVFVQKYIKDIKIFHEKVNGLPLALNVAAKYILHNDRSISDFTNPLEKGSDYLDVFSYHNKNIHAVLQTSFKNFSPTEQKILISTGVFAGKDFSLETIAYINDITKKETKKYLEILINFSLVEKSTRDRYRVHPLVKMFLLPKVKKALYVKTAEFYLGKLKKKKTSEHYYSRVATEFININTVFDKCLTLEKSYLAISIWKYLSNYMWNTRHWAEFEMYGHKIYNLCSKTNDNKMKIILCIDKFSQLYYWQLNISLSEQYIRRGLKLAKKIKDNYLVHCAKQRLGCILIGKNELKASQKLLTQANHYFLQEKNYGKCTDTLKNLGEIALRNESLQKANHYFLQAQQAYKYKPIKASRLVEQAIVLIYQGEVYFLQQQFLNAQKCFQKGIRFCVKSEEKWGIRAFGYIGLGLIYEQKGEVLSARTYYTKAKQGIDLPGFKDYLMTQNSFFFAIKHILKKSAIFQKYWNK